MLGRHCHLEAVRYPASLLEKMRGGGRWTDIGCGLFEQSEPPVEVSGLDPKRQMGKHRLAVIAA
jgi:hypothetical protein